MEMLIEGFKNFNINKFMSTNPPSDYSFDTSQEIKELVKIPLNKRFVEEKDDIKSYFKKIGDRTGVEFYPESIAEELIEQTAPLIHLLLQVEEKAQTQDLPPEALVVLVVVALLVALEL